MGSANSIQSMQDNKSASKTIPQPQNTTQENNTQSETIFFFINNQFDIGESLFYNFNRNFTLPVQS